MARGGTPLNNLRPMADAEEPEFGIRLFGYSRREVDAFVSEVRRELRMRSGGTGDVTVIGSSPSGESAVARLLRLAAEAAEQRRAESVGEAELTLLSARELADRMDEEARERVREAAEEAGRLVAEARRRARELEEKVAEALEREVASRVGELAQAHERLVAGLAGVRDALAELLARDADRGPVSARALVPRQGRPE
jgi:cell division septum initiation protein DivIVA